NLGSVLAVSMQHHYDIEAAGDSVLISCLLVSAVAQVPGVAMDGQLIQLFDVLVAEGGIQGVVGGTIVEKEDFFDLVPYLFGYAVESPIELVHRIVGNYKDADPLVG